MSEITQEAVIEAIKLVEDPDLFLNIWFLGLIYGIAIDQDLKKVSVDMTLYNATLSIRPAAGWRCEA